MSNLQVGDLISLLGGGNAKQSEVLEGKTFSSEYGTEIKGTMPDNSNINLNRTITSQNGAVNIPKGYTPGGRVTCTIKDLVPAYILKGVTIGGVSGTYEEDKYMGIITPGMRNLEIRPLPTEDPDAEFTSGTHRYLVLGDLKSGTIRFWKNDGKFTDVTYDIMTGEIIKGNDGSRNLRRAKYDPQTRVLTLVCSSVYTVNYTISGYYNPMALNLTFK